MRGRVAEAATRVAEVVAVAVGSESVTDGPPASAARRRDSEISESRGAEAGGGGGARLGGGRRVVGEADISVRYGSGAHTPANID